MSGETTARVPAYCPEHKPNITFWIIHVIDQHSRSVCWDCLTSDLKGRFYQPGLKFT